MRWSRGESAIVCVRNLWERVRLPASGKRAESFSWLRPCGRIFALPPERNYGPIAMGVMPKATAAAVWCLSWVKISGRL